MAPLDCTRKLEPTESEGVVLFTANADLLLRDRHKHAISGIAALPRGFSLTRFIHYLLFQSLIMKTRNSQYPFQKVFGRLTTGYLLFC